MTINQWIKTIIKIITILPVVMKGIQTIIQEYKNLNDVKINGL